MSELFLLNGSVAYDAAAQKHTGAPTSENVDPAGIVVVSLASDVVGNRVCVINTSPDVALLAGWNGGEKAAVAVAKFDAYANKMELPANLQQACQHHFVPDRLIVSQEVSLAPKGAMDLVQDEVLTLSHVRTVVGEGLRPENTLEGAVATRVVMAAHDRHGESVLIVMPDDNVKKANRLSADGAVRRVTGIEIVPQAAQMERIMDAMQGCKRLPRRVIVATNLKPTFGGGVS